MPRQHSEHGGTGVPTPSLDRIPDQRFGYDEARHLLWRAGFGGTPRQIRTLAEMGPRRAVAFLVNVDEIEGYPRPTARSFEHDLMSWGERERMAFQRARAARDEEALARLRGERERRQQQDRAQIRAMQRWWLTRMIETPRPLEEKMTLFWHGHFATNYRTIENSYHMFLQNQLFRSEAVGSFETLLHGIVRDPAMLRYLDNHNSRQGAPNENLARELMELFSLGEGNYSERDIKEGARALTGHTYEGNEFVFREEWHDSGAKRVLGRSGNFAGEGFVKAILARQACAEFICFKLYRFFVGDLGAPGSSRREVSETVVRRLAGTLRRSDYRLAPVLTELFESEHFYDEANELTRIKSPAELVVGSVRALGTPTRDVGTLVDSLDRMGQNLLFPPSVKGWDGERSWINTSTMFVRQNVLNFLLTGRTMRGWDEDAQREAYDPRALLTDLAEVDPGSEKDPRVVVRYLLRANIGGEPTAGALDALDGFMASVDDRVTRDTLVGLLSLIASMPEYQLT
ncbi:MAG: DUF1800 domain-containing protein [Planctomycetota bacterium]